ncbi:MAG: hypothetical protein IPP72_21905 [Chitinophagaceae bacterium]|nr:hypothetical protein [Chitinophagaceae bacterium]
MKKGIQRFDFFLNLLEVLMLKADKQKNPGLFLYQNNARTPLFMLEGLSKMYTEIHNRNKFSKLKEHFKLLEDAIGAIDYYDSLAKNLKSNKKIPAKVFQYLQAQSREKIQHLNELLNEKKWIDNNNARILKIKKKLAEADWQDEENEMAAIQKFYTKSIGGIIDFTHSTAYHFDNMEEDVHELRRKLRWLSIYPQALLGSVQLATSKSKAKHLSKYLTETIVNSPYNKMPDAAENNQFLLLCKNYFLSLSWVIDALGKLKDEGLQIVAIKEALQQTEGIDEATAIKKVYQLLGNKQTKLPALLENAASISQTWFREKNLEQLVIGTVKNL